MARVGLADRRSIAAFGAAQARGEGRVELDGSLVETPIYAAAKRPLERAEALARYDGRG